jgi:hypothetical protein
MMRCGSFACPPAANRFDYTTLTDALVTYEYRALNNYDYGQALINRLKPEVTTDLAFSVRDGMHGTTSTTQTSSMMPIDGPSTWTSKPQDCPPNLYNHRLTNIALRFCGTDTVIKTLPVAGMTHTDPTGHVSEANPGVAHASMATSARTPAPVPFGTH